jgi:hypothetical protein
MERNGLKSVAATVAFALGLGLSPGVHASAVLDWDMVDYSAGSLTQSFSVGGIDLDFAFSGDTNFQSGAPDDTSVLTGGLGSQQSLQIQLDHPQNTDTVQLDVSFSEAVAAVAFSIFDVDTGTGGASFHDDVTISGFLGSASVAPILTAVGTTFNISGSTATGHSQAANSTSQGTLSVAFSGPIDALRIIYGNDSTAPADPGPQGIGLHDISFAQVPEPPTIAVFGLSLFGLLFMFPRRLRRVGI